MTNQSISFGDDFYAVYCGRFNPIHIGHEAVINEMLKLFGSVRSRIIVGSANASQSLRHFFSYEERRNLIKTIFPDVITVPLGDFSTSDEEWMVALDDLLISSGMDPKKTVFFGGCEEDIVFFLKLNRKCHILNRFDGTTPKVSATEVRDSLIHNRPMDTFLNPLIMGNIKNLFDMKWMDFQKK
jgi:bifunctional NMN adenylyltransferase/nudix hydrolase